MALREKKHKTLQGREKEDVGSAGGFGSISNPSFVSSGHRCRGQAAASEYACSY